MGTPSKKEHKAHPLHETQIQALFSSCKHATEWRQQSINALSVFVFQWPSWTSQSFGKRVVAPQVQSSSTTNVFPWAARSTDSSFCFWGNVCEGMQDRDAGSSTPDPTCLSHVNHLSVITQQLNLIVQAGTWKTKAATHMWGLKWLASAENCPSWDNYVPFCEWACGSSSEKLAFRSIADMQHFFCKNKYILLNIFVPAVSSSLWDWNSWILFGFTGLIFFAWGCSNTAVSPDTQLLARTVRSSQVASEN